MQKRKKKIQKPSSPGKFYTEALQLAKLTRIEDLMRKTNLPLSWLRKFRAGEIINPSVNRVEKILASFDRI